MYVAGKIIEKIGPILAINKRSFNPKMLLKKLVSNCPSHLRNIKISDLTSDSREVKKNSLFFAIKGKKL